MGINDKLQQLIDDKNITVIDLSKTLNKTRATIYSYLRGDSQIDVESLVKICEEYSVPISYFIKDEEKKELFNRIEELEEKIREREFYLSMLLYDTIDVSKSEIPPPENWYNFPKITELSYKYHHAVRPLNKKRKSDKDNEE